MTEVITRHGEDRIAQCQGTGQVLTIDKFVLSYDPTIDPTAAIDRDSLLPPTDQIVYSHDVTKSGYINPSQVVYSLFMDSTVGPFQFNRMDLVESATNINIAIATIGTQTKVADDPQNGIRGQAMTRNFMTIYDSAAEITNISVDAASWQIDFIARLKASDELERLTTRDIWGRNCFWGDAFKVTPAGGNNNYQLGAGRGFVEGVRIHSDGSAQFIAGTLPTDVWLDVSLQGDINGVQPKVEVVLSNTPLSDSTDGHQVYHFMERIASLDTAGNVTDLRNSKAIGDTLLKYIDQQDQQVNGDMSAEITSQISGLRSYIDNKVSMAKVPKMAMAYVTCEWDGTVSTMTEKRAFGDLFDVSGFFISSGSRDLIITYNKIVNKENLYINATVVRKEIQTPIEIPKIIEVAPSGAYVFIRTFNPDTLILERLNLSLCILVLGDW